ncbi:MAG TPA: hypothetical protein VKZ79_17515 [Alphaproteobacteria bacterium]|nr:hypothetical protein [Alphaproteobacteria bacterium]
METAPAGPDGDIDLVQSAAIVPLNQHAEQDGEDVPDEISGLKQLGTEVADKIAVDAAPVLPIEVTAGTGGSWHQERDLAQESAKTMPLNRQAEQDGEVIVKEIPDLKRPASDPASNVAMDATSAPSLEIAMGDDGLAGDEAEIAPVPATTPELVLSGLHTVEDDERGPPRGGAIASLRPASVPAAEAGGVPDPALPDAPSVLRAGEPPREDEYGPAAASSSKPGQSREFADEDENGVAEVGGGERAEGEDFAAAAEAEAEAEQCAAGSVPHVIGSAVNPGDSAEPATEQAMSSAGVLTEGVPEDPAGEVARAEQAVVRTKLRSPKPAQHRDRRGQRRALPSPAAPAPTRPSPAEASLRTPAEAKLRLMLHPIRRTATLSAVLARPPGYPDSVTLLLGEGAEISAYSEDRYDDVDLEWTADLLSREVRLDCKEGYQWLRSGRRIQIFGEVADEPGVISVGSAGLSSASTIVCLREDADAVRAAAEACGSPTLVPHDSWSGIPDGWTVLSGYRPAHAAPSGLAAGLTGLDPGVGSEIRLSGGLRIRSASFAEGWAPRIEIAPFPAGATVTIDGHPAEQGEDGAWTADGWEQPGDHLIDVVPGPSAAYRIIEDPWTRDGWEAWDAHPERFGASARAPWAVAEVCGAAVSGPGAEYVVAAEAMLSVVCLGLRRGAVVLRGRPDAPVAVGLLGEPPAFLISASGQRRRQGRIIWLSPLPIASGTRAVDPLWVAEVRRASARRLPLDGGGAPAEDAWRKARERARRHKRPRS